MGLFKCSKSQHTINIVDDLEYLYDSDFFHENKDKLFKTEDIDEELLEDASRTHRKKLSLKDDNIKLDVNELNDDMYGDVFELNKKNLEIHNLKDIEVHMDASSNLRSRKETESACSSRSSNTRK